MNALRRWHFHFTTRVGLATGPNAVAINGVRRTLEALGALCASVAAPNKSSLRSLCLRGRLLSVLSVAEPYGMLFSDRGGASEDAQDSLSGSTCGRCRRERGLAERRRAD